MYHLCHMRLMCFFNRKQNIIEHIIDVDFMQRCFGILSREVNIVLFLTVVIVIKLWFGETPCFVV